MHRMIATALLALLAGAVLAADPASVSFQHNDWEVHCDNTRACRAAGYHPDEPDAPPVSVLLTRYAGPNQPVSGRVTFGNYGDNAPEVPKVLALKINGRAVGNVKPNKDLIADLTRAQVDALLAALPRTSTIEFVGKDTTWELSGKGAAAALLKMDEFQGRIGTVGALVRKGSKAEDAALPPLAPPVIVAPPVPKALDKALQAELDKKAIAAELKKAIKPEDCDEHDKIGTAENPLEINPLTNGKLVVSVQCWHAAYNSGSGFVVINAKPPYAPVVVTTQASDYNDGSIGLSQKGRGLGDCWAAEDWTWDGQQFVHTRATWTGMCRLITPGGPWDLPTIVTTVKRAGTPAKP